MKPFTEEILLSSVLASVSRDAVSSYAGAYIETPVRQVNIEKINTGNLFHIAAGDDNFVMQMLESFLHSTEKGLGEMQEAAKKGDNESVAGLSHKLQPPCRHLGANDLFNLLNKVEKAVKSNETASVESEIKEIIDEFSSVRQAVADQISKIKGKA